MNKMGEKLLQLPKIGFDCREIYRYFGFTELKTMSDGYFENANRLVELNNEIYYMVNGGAPDANS